MSVIFTTLLFATAFVAGAWTLYASVRPQLHRYRELFAPVTAMPALPMQPTRITVRWSAPVRSQAQSRMRAAA